MTKSRIRFFLLILYLSFFGGAIGIFAKIALPAFSPITMIFFRVGISILIFFVYLTLKKDLASTLKKVFKRWKFFLALALTGIGAAMVVGFMGLRYTTVINYGLIYNLSAIFILIFSIILLKEKTTRLDIVYITVAFLGAIIIATDGKLEFDVSKSYFIGNILVLISAIGWALYSVLGAKLMRDDKNYDSITVNFGAFLVAFVFLLPVTALKPSFGINVSNLSLETIGGLLGLSVFSTAILFLAWFKLVDSQGGIWATFIALSENLTGVVLPVIFLGEALTIPIAIGGILMVSSICGKELLDRYKRPKNGI